MPVKKKKKKKATSPWSSLHPTRGCKQCLIARPHVCSEYQFLRNTTCVQIRSHDQTGRTRTGCGRGGRNRGGFIAQIKHNRVPSLALEISKAKNNSEQGLVQVWIVTSFFFFFFFFFGGGGGPVVKEDRYNDITCHKVTQRYHSIILVKSVAQPSRKSETAVQQHFRRQEEGGEGVFFFFFFFIESLYHTGSPLGFSFV